MVYYPTPKYIKKTHMRGARPYRFGRAFVVPHAVADEAVCLRCAQSVCKDDPHCNKPADRRCDHCVSGNRGQCTLVPNEFNGRVNRLLQLRVAYDGAVAAATTPRTDAAVIETGVKLARAQRTFNLSLSSHRRVAAHTGTPLGVPSQVPTTTPQLLSLVLVEQRRIATALEALVGHASRMNATAAGDDDDDSDDEEENVEMGGEGEVEEGEGEGEVDA